MYQAPALLHAFLPPGVE